MPRGVFLSDEQRAISQLVLDLGYKEDAVLFGLLRIQSFLKKIANCKLVHCQDAREYLSMFFCASMSRCLLDIRNSILTEVLRIVFIFHTFGQCK
jgi:hypothetical protein